jgi:hypothetical protein
MMSLSPSSKWTIISLLITLLIWAAKQNISHISMMQKYKSARASVYQPKGMIISSTNNTLLIPEQPNADLAEEFVQKIPKEDAHRIFSNCSVTSQVQITMKSPFWELQALDGQGKEKKIGGDEFYITYTDSSVTDQSHPTAVARLTDLENGKYQMDFVTSAMNPIVDPKKLNGHGTLNIYFQFTCGIGRMPPPTKNNWPDGGNSVARHVHQGGVQLPPLRIFQAPKATVDFSKYRLVFVGDSLMQHFVAPIGFEIPNIYRGLNSATYYDFLDVVLHTVDGALRTDHANKSSKPIALILGSAVWDLLEHSADVDQPHFENHIAACRRLVTDLQRIYHPSAVTVVWKSPTGMHIHIPAMQVKQGKGLPDAFLTTRIRYMSESRSRLLYILQKELMQELRIPFLDVYEATYISADYTLHGDGRHYRKELNKLTTNFFF